MTPAEPSSGVRSDAPTVRDGASDAAAARLEGISKSFPGVKALDDVSLDVRRGEVHALLGENGAGKSTLVKILAGLIRPDSGHIRLDDAEVVFGGPRDAQRRGISYVPQEVQAVPDFSVGRNMLLGFEGPFDRKGKLTAKDLELELARKDQKVFSVEEKVEYDRLKARAGLTLEQTDHRALARYEEWLLEKLTAAYAAGTADPPGRFRALRLADVRAEARRVNQPSKY